MRVFFDKLIFICILILLVSSITSGAWLYLWVKNIKNDPIFKEAKNILIERALNEVN